MSGNSVEEPAYPDPNSNAGSRGSAGTRGGATPRTNRPRQASKKNWWDRAIQAVGGIHKLVIALIGLAVAIIGGYTTIVGLIHQKDAPAKTQQPSITVAQPASQPQLRKQQTSDPDCDPKLGDQKKIKCNPR